MKNKIIKKKKNHLTLLKELTKWMVSRNQDQDTIKRLIAFYEIDNGIIKRLLSYVYGYPHIIWYYNKYLNHLYSFEKMDTIDLLNSFSYILKVNNKTNSREFLYLKGLDSADNNRSKIRKLLSEYFVNVYNRHMNLEELNFYYELFNLGEIKINSLIDVDKHLNNNKSNLRLDNVDYSMAFGKERTQDNLEILDINNPKPDIIQQFENHITNFKPQRNECQKCELFNSPIVVIDSNKQQAGPVDIMFIGLNPGKDEVTFKRPFVGKSGALLREKMSFMPAGVSWLITNFILCHTRNEKDIGNPKQVATNCRGMFEELYKHFPSEKIVLLGRQAIDAVGIQGKISNISGKVIERDGFTYIPLIHPSAAANYGKKKEFDEGFETVYRVLEGNSPIITAPIQETVQQTKKPSLRINTPSAPRVKQYNIPPENIINEITSDLTLFDIKEVDYSIVKIFMDANGVKKYKIDENTIDFYIKYDDWNQCNMITDKVDAKVTINGANKYKIAKRVRDKIAKQSV